MTIIAALLLLGVLCALSVAAMALRVRSADDARRRDRGQEDYWAARSAAETAVASIRTDLPSVFRTEFVAARGASAGNNLPSFDAPGAAASVPLFSEAGWNYTWVEATKSFSVEDRGATNSPAASTSLLGNLDQWLSSHSSVPGIFLAQRDRDGAAAVVTLKEAYRVSVSGNLSPDPMYVVRYAVAATKNGQREELQGLIALSAVTPPAGTQFACGSLALEAPAAPATNPLGPIPPNTFTGIPIAFRKATHVTVTPAAGGPPIHDSTYAAPTDGQIEPSTPVLASDTTFVVVASNGACDISANVLVRVQGSNCGNVGATPNSFNFPASGGGAAINVTAGNNCANSASTTAPWVTITSPASATGDRAVGFSVSANPGGTRTGTISIGGQGGPVTVTVTQSPAACNYTINPVNSTYPSTGGSGQIDVTTSAYCDWTASTATPWLHVTAGTSGTGAGTLSYSVDSNQGPARQGTIQVAGYNFFVDQAGACSGPPAITSFTATQSGSDLTLAWGVSGADSLTIDQGVGGVTGLASKTLAVPASTTTFTLTAANGCGTQTAQVTYNAQGLPWQKTYKFLNSGIADSPCGVYARWDAYTVGQRADGTFYSVYQPGSFAWGDTGCGGVTYNDPAGGFSYGLSVVDTSTSVRGNRVVSLSGSAGQELSLPPDVLPGPAHPTYQIELSGGYLGWITLSNGRTSYTNSGVELAFDLANKAWKEAYLFQPYYNQVYQSGKDFCYGSNVTMVEFAIPVLVVDDAGGVQFTAHAFGNNPGSGYELFWEVLNTDLGPRTSSTLTPSVSYPWWIRDGSRGAVVSPGQPFTINWRATITGVPCPGSPYSGSLTVPYPN